MTYLISQLWLYLLCAGLLGLLLGWVIWGWFGRRKITTLRAKFEQSRLSLTRGFEEDRAALEEQKVAAFRARDEALETKDTVEAIRNNLTQKLQAKQAAMAGAETATNAAHREAEEARAEITRLQMAAANSNEQAVKAEVERVRQSMQRTLDEERNAKDAARAELTRLTSSEREAKDQVLRLQSRLAATPTAGQGSAADSDRLRRELEQARQRQRELEEELAKLRAQLNQHETISVKKPAPQKFTTDAPRPASLFDRRPDTVDDLKEIKGIGPVMERVLNENGCYHFKQLANFSKRDIEWISAALGSFPDRIERDEWVRQAQSLYFEKYGQRHDVGEVGQVRTLATTS